VAKRKLPVPKTDTHRNLLANIERVGWGVIAILEDDEGPTYAFSAGLFHSYGHPEITLMGVPSATAMHIINDLGTAVREGRQFEAGSRTDGILERFPVAFISVAERYMQEYFGTACWLYGGPDFPVVQCVWPDKQGVFPWETGFNADLFQFQRLLGPVDSLPNGWPFADPPNLTTFTVRSICEGKQPILLACHDADGSWQFLTGEPVQMKDMLIVSLQHVFALDASLAEVANLPPGQQAQRKRAGNPWERSSMADEKAVE
jgi:hypothetical protein